MNKTMSTKMTRQIGSPKSAIHKKLDFSMAVQRDFIWTDDQKSLLIHSLLDGYVVPPLLIDDRGDDVLRVMDGKQRCRTIMAFYNNEFKLSPNTPALENGVEIAGMKYSKLPDELREILDNAEIVMWHIKGLNDNTRDEMFYRINNGSALVKMELTRALAGEEVVGYLNSISAKDLFAKRAILSTVGRKRKVDNELVLQCLSLFTMRNAGFSGKELQAFAMSMKHNPLTDEQKASFEETIAYIESAFPEIAEDGKVLVYDNLKKVNIPAIVKLAEVALHNGVAEGDFYMFTEDFFKDMKPGCAYKNTTTAGSATKRNIRKRFELLLEAFVKYMKNADGTELEIPDNCSFNVWAKADEDAKAEAERVKAEKAVAKADRMRLLAEKRKAKAEGKEAPVVKAEAVPAEPEEPAFQFEEEPEDSLVNDAYTMDEDEDEEDTEPSTILEAIRQSKASDIPTTEEKDEAYQAIFGTN